MKFKIFNLSVSLAILINICSAATNPNKTLKPTSTQVTNSKVAKDSYKEGVDYKLLINAPESPDVAKGKVLVQEFFSFSCPHCAHTEKFVQKYLYTNPKIMLQRIQVLWGEETEGYAKLNETLIAQNLPQLYAPIFDEVSTEQDKEQVEMVKGINKPETIIALLKKNKISANEIKKFMDLYNSFSVQTQVNKTKVILEKDNINATPTFIVGNKYQVTGAEPEEEMKVINYLVKKLS